MISVYRFYRRCPWNTMLSLHVEVKVSFIILTYLLLIQIWQDLKEGEWKKKHCWLLTAEFFLSHSSLLAVSDWPVAICPGSLGSSLLRDGVVDTGNILSSQPVLIQHFYLNSICHCRLENLFWIQVLCAGYYDCFGSLSEVQCKIILIYLDVE